MPAYKDKTNNQWYLSFYYRDWTGKNKRKVKRGFATKKEAIQWERQFYLQHEGNPELTMNEFYLLYKEDIMHKIKLNTWLTKEHVIDTKILPFFGDMQLNKITPLVVTKWHNIIANIVALNNEKYSSTYLKSVHSQLSAMLNHAVKFYNLKSNPCKVTGRIGSQKSEKEMLFWTKEEYLQFSQHIKDKDISFYAFEILYWCGIRIGELRALTKRDIDFDKKTIRINKSNQRIHGEDVITKPKTPKSNRIILLPDFLCERLKDYFLKLHYYENDQPIFPVSKSYFGKEMERGCKLSGVKKIRIHDLRHSHVSMLINMGFSPVDIANRMGHESIKVTLDYAHMFPTQQQNIVNQLNLEGENNE